MAVRGRGYPVAATLIRTWVIVLDRCMASGAPAAGALETFAVLLTAEEFFPERPRVYDRRLDD